MEISCPQCGTDTDFVLRVWVRVVFQFEADGTVTLLHLEPLESIEEKLTDQARDQSVTCETCGNPAVIRFNPHASAERVRQARSALEGL